MIRSRKKFVYSGLSISFFLHFFLLSYFIFIWHFPIKLFDNEKKPFLYIPSYVANPLLTSHVSQKPVVEHNDTSPLGIQKSLTKTTPTPPANHAVAVAPSQNSESVHLLGEKNVDNKLLKMLGKALSQHLIYPKSAIDFRIKGIAVIGFTLYPDGHITDIRLIKTSKSGVLDEAALNAARQMIPLKDITALVNKPRFLTIGVIFG